MQIITELLQNNKYPEALKINVFSVHRKTHEIYVFNIYLNS